MSPEQMQSMMAGMRNMDPSMMSAAMAQMKNMSASDWEAARAQAAGMDPDQMARQAQAASAQLTAQQQYVLNGSRQLKDEGNKLVAAGRHAEAAEKYARAKANLADAAAREAKDVVRACCLNLALCRLKTGRPGEAVDECDFVLKGERLGARAVCVCVEGVGSVRGGVAESFGDTMASTNSSPHPPLFTSSTTLPLPLRTTDEPANVKALYRRGWARLELAQPAAAAADLEAALARAGADAAQRAPIEEKLAAARAALAAEGGAGSGGPRAQQQRQRQQAEQQQTVVIEEVVEDGKPAAAGAAGAAAAAAAGGGGDEDGRVEDVVEEIATPAQRRAEAKAREEAKERRERERRAAGAAASAAASAGAPAMPGGDDMARMAQVRAAASLALSLSSLSLSPPAECVLKHPSPPPLTIGPRLSPANSHHTNPKMMADNPDMLKAAAEMMASLPPEQMASMAAAAPGMTPEMARMAAEQVRLFAFLCAVQSERLCALV